ncbi:hypothetical protein SAMN05444266_11447 [Chitinophaga jiangningensis]|uniref:Uncharacterized protein n=1 Tax=Chitinophaga jiangningensis TaxID=1419482 RepID=A0A1M7MR21_9BACT|nr:hypothetical protein [Chitinophaga jiangningensis]SHM93511.1 hypothetical protein SAMN05444266_11447 [Chitinophaga jiangningensis]
MKSFAHFLLILILAYVAGMVLPWWSAPLAAFLITVMYPLRPGKAFFNSFLSVFILWLVLAFYQDVRNDHLLANKMSLIIMQVKSAPLLGVISAFLGGLVAGFAGLTAAYLRSAGKPVATA